jgi:hypothetical protein
LIRSKSGAWRGMVSDIIAWRLASFHNWGRMPYMQVSDRSLAHGHNTR